MGYILLGLGIVLLVEGLVYALAPSLVESMLQALKELPIETRRWLGLGAMVLGVIFLLLAHQLGVVG